MSSAESSEGRARRGADADPDRVAAARLWASDRFPYLASALFALRVEEIAGLGGIQADRWWRVGHDPGITSEWSVAELGAELVHLSGHLLRGHAERADKLDLGSVAELAHWVDAVDAELQDDLPTEVDRPRPVVSAADLGRPDGELAEVYWRLGRVRRGRPGEMAEESSAIEAICDCGSAAHGQTGDWEPLPPGEGGSGVDGAQAELLRQQVAHDVATAVDAPEGLRRWARELRRPKVDWRRCLGASLRRAISVRRGAVDYSYRRPSRRAGSTPDVVLASLQAPTVTVAVVVDTSASVDETQLGAALSEVEGITRVAGGRIRILSCDDAVHVVADLRRVDDVVLVGGGGTDLRVGLDAACDLRPRPDVVVVVTDGFTPWPESPPGRADVIVALLEADVAGAGGGAPGIEPAWIPPWAETVTVSLDAGGGRASGGRGARRGAG